MSKLVPFSDLAHVNPPLSVAKPAPDKMVSFIPMTDVSDSGEWRNRQARKVGEIGPGYTPFQDQDVLFAKITPCMENGKGCHARDLVNGIGFGSTEFHVLRAKTDQSSRFVYHWSRSEWLRTAAAAAMSGSAGQQRVEASFFERYEVAKITPTEQTRIAEILDTLDEAIREAEAVIAKLRQVKAGLLHDLLTRGLDEHGHLRDPIRHPDQFQNSPLGLIPKAWTDTTLGHVLRERGGTMQTGPFGSQLHSSDYVTEGIPVIMPQDIGDDGEMDTVAAAKITPERAQPLSRHRIRQGDIIFARRGDLSRCGVARSTAVGLCGTGCLLYRPAPKSLHPEWFATVYRHDFVQKQIAAKAVGTTMVNLNTGLLTSLELAVPDWDEQVAVVDRITSFASKVRAEESTLSKLQNLKRGLSHDLLTGRKRVKIPDMAK